MEVDYLIVGQGIAGSVFAEHVYRSGKSFQVIGDPNITNSSIVAGGLYNPITGRKMVKTWNCDNLFRYLIPFYKSVEDKLSSSFFHELSIYRPFYSFEEQNEWMGKSIEPTYSSYVKNVITSSDYSHLVKDDFGGLLLDKSGYMNTAEFVKSYRDWLRNNDLYREERFNESDLNFHEEKRVVYKDVKAKRIVFCEGIGQLSCRFFKWLPTRPVKGELIWIKTEEDYQMIFNRGVFTIPVSEKIYKVGATYDHTNLDNEITFEAKLELEQRLKKLIKFDYEIVDQKAGIRPATKDRKPFVGRHPKHENVYIFNGLGAKGVSLAPYYANQLVSFIENGTELDAEVNIQRFFSLL